MDWTAFGLDWIGLDRIDFGLNSSGLALDWTEFALHWIGLDWLWVGLDGIWIGLD